MINISSPSVKCNLQCVCVFGFGRRLPPNHKTIPKEFRVMILVYQIWEDFFQEVCLLSVKDYHHDLKESGES